MLRMPLPRRSKLDRQEKTAKPNRCGTGECAYYVDAEEHATNFRLVSISED